MPRSQDQLANALEALHELQSTDAIAIKSSQLSRSHRETLLRNGFLLEVIRGWYISTRPDQPPTEATAWYVAYWSFCADYLNSRFGTDWILSPELSLSLHAGNHSVPLQLIVRAAKGDNKATSLPFDTSLLTIRAALPKEHSATVNGMRVYSVPAALVNCSAVFFKNNAADARSAFASISDVSDLAVLLLDGSHATVASRIAGGLRNVGKGEMADRIVTVMKRAGHDTREHTPFTDKLTLSLSSPEESPYSSRVRYMWAQFRETVINNFPVAPGLPVDHQAYLENVDDVYETDAYNSLSIEGYQVSAELIRRVRSGKWNPDNNEFDSKQRDALAARGYWQAYQAVRTSISSILNGTNAGEVINKGHHEWYEEMFNPLVAAGIFKPSDLVGYRRGPVYIRRARHVPPSYENVQLLMPVLFELIMNEPEASVRTVLGHFFFVFIHPYMDGNGRIGRFLMNTMLASGGYDWCVVPLARRPEYFSALNSASVDLDIVPFTRLLADLVEHPLRSGY